MNERASTLAGRRLPDLLFGQLHHELAPGDYWKIVDGDGNPLKRASDGKLTEDCWYVVVPLGGGYGLGRLEHHTVREHEDGTISVRPGDGSSNSILISKGPDGPSWHGYIDHGVFEKC